MNNKNTNKTIVWGKVFWDVKTGKKADIRITNIHVDTMYNEVTVIRETGVDVKKIKLTMEQAIEIGFINLNALMDYC